MAKQHFIVQVDFGDNVVESYKHFQQPEELAAYLAKVPSMIGFHMQQCAQITISSVVAQAPETLPGI